MPQILPPTTRLNEVFTNWAGGQDTGGFFYYLKYYADHESPAIEIPFLTNTNELDLEYHGNISGNKIISCLVEKFVDTEFFDAYALKLAALFWKINGEPLLKQFDTYSLEYNPIQNYNMQESGNDSHTGKDTIQNSGGYTDTKTGWDTSTDSIQGYNSVDFNDADKTRNDYNSTIERTDDSGTETTYASGYSHGLTRSGNIGVTTSQRMIEAEHNLWMWNFYYQVLFPAVDRVLTIPIY